MAPARQVPQQLPGQPVVELREVLLPELDHPEPVLPEDLPLPPLPLRVLRRVQPPVLDGTLPERHVEVRVRVLRHRQAALVRVREVPRVQPVVDQKLRLRPDPVPVRDEEPRGGRLLEVLPLGANTSPS